MEIDRKELKRRARERMALTDPKFWLVALAYLAMTTGISCLVSLIPIPKGGPTPIPDMDTIQLFFRLLLNLYTTVVQFGLCLWALWTYRQLDPGINSLMQGFSVSGRVILMQLGIYVRVLGWYFLAALGLSVPMVILLTKTSDFAAFLLLISLFVLALLAVLVVVSLQYSLAPYLLADRPDDGATAPLRRSSSLMRGWKWELFKLEFSFIGYHVLNFILSAAVILFFISRAGLLFVDLTDAAVFSAWQEQCMTVINSAPVLVLSTLITVPVNLWLIPYQATARAGFYDARLLACTQGGELPEMPPL